MIIYTDGAATMKCINGEYTRENGGWAWAAIDDNDNLIKADFGGGSNTTNNRMELMAILNALRTFKKDLTIYSDSAYCVNMLKPGGWIYGWERNGWARGKKHEPIENLEIIKEIWGYLGNNIEFIKIKGHACGDDWNAFVDKLAVEGKTNDYTKSLHLNIIDYEDVKKEVIKHFLNTVRRR